MRAYQLAAELRQESWPDVDELRHHPAMVTTAAQLYTAIGSISARLAEGYSRSSGRDRARIFEYPLGSTPESIEWYQSGQPVLGREITTARLNKLEEIRRLLLATIPRERERLIRPRKTSIERS